MAEIKWEDFSSPIGDDEIKNIEGKLGVRLPSDFVEVAKEHHGGVPSPNSFYYNSPYAGKVKTNLTSILSFDLDDVEGIVDTYEDLKDQLPDGVVPFGDEGGGDYVCFDYRSDASAPRVIYWAHEFAPEDAIIPLASTFTEFLEKLK